MLGDCCVTGRSQSQESKLLLSGSQIAAAVEGGPGSVVTKRQLRSRGNGLGSGVSVTDRIWGQLAWLGGDVEENRSTKGLSSSQQISLLPPPPPLLFAALSYTSGNSTSL